MSSRAERKLQDRLNRIARVAPGLHRINQIGQVALNLEIEAQLLDDDPSSTYDDVEPLLEEVLFLRRLEWDLHELRRAARGTGIRQNGVLPGPRP